MVEQIKSIEYNEPVSFVIDDDMSGERVDKLLSFVLCDYSRSFIQNLLNDGLVFCNGKNISKSFKPKQGDVISFTVPEPKEISLEPENIPLDIIYEDADLLIVNKPRGMVVHPAPGNYSSTLVNALLWHCKGNLSGINGVIRPGIVHRIDKDTSGLLLVAKNDSAHISLSQQISVHSLDREYRAVIHGHLKDIEGTVDAPIGRNPNDRKKMCVTNQNSKNAVTHYTVLEEYKDFSFVKLKLETGRTHQIRVHMAYLGHPVAGDPVYGPKNGVTSLNGQCLHAGLLGFIHPSSGEHIIKEAPLPEYFTDFLRRINKNGK
ncbi:MAG: RluA family pseudouridine synthase [Acutalibacteraceae bacterium]|nr:RluA family pseudouridine synthase [Acutalibacteraceae bacterium]